MRPWWSGDVSEFQIRRTLREDIKTLTVPPMALVARIPLRHAHVPHSSVVRRPLIRTFPRVTELLRKLLRLCQTLSIGPMSSSFLLFQAALPGDIELESPGGRIIGVFDRLRGEETHEIVRMCSSKIQRMETSQEESLLFRVSAFYKGGGRLRSGAG